MPGSGSLPTEHVQAKRATVWGGHPNERYAVSAWPASLVVLQTRLNTLAGYDF